MFLFGPQLRLTHLIFNLSFISRYISPWISQFWILIACEHLRECRCFINSPPYDVIGLSDHLWPSYKTSMYVSFPSSANKAFPFLHSFTYKFRFRYWTLLSHFYFNFQLIIYTYFPHVFFNSWSCMWRHLFHFTVLPRYLNIFALVVTV
jgi:hypothetical protein